MTATADPEDYTGEDGLLYCGKCRTAKEAYFPKETVAWLGHEDVYKRQEIEIKREIEKGHPAHAYGRYQNVFLTDGELADLQASFPTVWGPVSYTHLDCRRVYFCLFSQSP